MHSPITKKITNSRWGLANLALIILLTAVLIANQILMSKMRSTMGISRVSVNSYLARLIGDNNSGQSIKLSGNLGEDAIKLVMIGGVPEKYGTTLGLSFDQVQPAINIMKRYDPDGGQSAIKLSSQLLARYKKVGLKISCEYCCSALAIIAADGSAACGCEHSQAMRGLLAYLLQNHTADFDDDQLLRELARWKSRYFPKQMIQKVATQIQSGQYTPDIAALLLGQTLPAYAAGSNSVPLPSSIESLPGMVGGC